MMERLTIDEVIEHCKRTTAKYEKLNGINKLETVDISFAPVKEYWEHRPVKEYLEELKRYRDLEEQGLLLRLPCKVGDIVYRLTKVGKRYDIRERVIDNMTYRLDYKGDIVWEIFSTVSDVLGKTVFLTREEAEKKLKEMEKVEKR